MDKLSHPCFSAVVSFALLILSGTVVCATASAWISRGMGGGGALFSVSMSPHDIKEIYMSTDMSSVFYSTNYGQSWETVDFRQLQGGHNSHVRSISNQGVLYSVHVPDDLDYGRPVISGGATWNVLAGDPTSGEVWWLHPKSGRQPGRSMCARRRHLPVLHSLIHQGMDRIKDTLVRGEPNMAIMTPLKLTEIHCLPACP